MDMHSKLTPNLDEEVIIKAKHFSKNNSISLSKIVEKYLDSLSEQKISRRKTTAPLTGELSDLLKKHRHLDMDKSRYLRLRDKYL
jgi:hypothetical protein